MIGIYKITSPNGKIYVGQSINVESRLAQYKKFQNCSSQPILYNSLKKYGVDKHKFEVITECLENQLNDLERYYQEIYSCVGKNGLNCRYVKTEDRSGSFSKEHLATRKKFTHGEAFRKMRSKNTKGKNNPMFGKKKENHPAYGTKRTPEQLEKMRIINTGAGNPMFGRSGDKHPRYKNGIAAKLKQERQDKLINFFKDLPKTEISDHTYSGHMYIEIQVSMGKNNYGIK